MMNEVKVEDKVEVKEEVTAEVKEKLDATPKEKVTEVAEGVLDRIRTENRQANMMLALQGNFIKDLQERYVKVVDACLEAINGSSSTSTKFYQELLDRIEAALRAAYLVDKTENKE